MYPPPNFRSSTGNIFADFGLPDYTELLTKPDLVTQIDAIICNRQLTRNTAARLLGISALAAC